MINSPDRPKEKQIDGKEAKVPPKPKYDLSPLQPLLDRIRKREQKPSTEQREVGAAPGLFADIAETTRGMREGKVVGEVAGLNVEHQDGACEIVSLDKEPPIVSEGSRITRDKVTEVQLPVEAFDKDGKIGQTSFAMREYHPVLKDGQENLPTTKQLMKEAGVENPADEYIAIGVPGWVSHDREGQSYYSKVFERFPPDMRVMTVAPIGSSGQTDEVGAITTAEETKYMDIDNYVLVVKAALTHLAEELQQKSETSGVKQTAKSLLLGHSWGGRTILEALRDRDWVEELHAKGLDVVGIADEPAVAMNTGFGIVSSVVEPARPLIESIADPKDPWTFAARRMTDKLRAPITKAITHTPVTKLKGDRDPFMEQIHKVEATSFAQTALPIAELGERPWTEERSRQAALNPLVAAVFVGEKDPLVNANFAKKLNKGILIKGEGHVPERNDVIAALNAKLGVAALANNQYDRFKDWYKGGAGPK